MAGARDPLEDMLCSEVDEKAVSDLVGSLESQLGDPKAPGASFADGKRDSAPPPVTQFSGKVRDTAGSVEPPQQGHRSPGLDQDPGAAEPLSGKSLSSSTSSGAAGAVIPSGAAPQTVGASPTISPAPGPGTLSTQSGAASFPRAAVLGPSAAPSPSTGPTGDPIRTASPGSQSLNGSAGAVKLVNSPVAPPAAGTGSVISTVSPGGSTIIASMATQPGFSGPQTSASGSLQRHPSPVAQNGVDPKGAQLVVRGSPSPSASSPQVLNHSTPLMHTKMLLPSQPVSGSSVILTSTPPPAVVQSPTSLTQTGTSTTAGVVKPAVNGVGQPTVALVRPPGAPVVSTSIQQQRPGLVAAPRAATPQPQLAVRPQQQTTIQLPPGFTMPPGECPTSERCSGVWTL